MANLEPKTVVAQHKCAACGSRVDVKLNKNGIAYYYCTARTENDEPCSHHQKWGRAHSETMQRNYLAARKASKTNESTEVTEHGPAETDIRDEPQKRPAFDPFDAFR